MNVYIPRLWENYLLTERIKRNSYVRQPAEYFFWRTFDQQEIDLVERQNGQLQTFEFKWKEKLGKQPVFFEKNYPNVPFTVVHRENYLDFIL